MMNKDLFLSIDIGSTYTKGALFGLSGDKLLYKNRAHGATTVDDLSRGFMEVVKALVPKSLQNVSLQDLSQHLPIRYSSSAKGGLSIAACGIVPELTAKMAKAAALSAGAKISSVYAYKLSLDDLDEINRNAPDILLLAGGTDGGNESYLIHNAEVLAQLHPQTVIIYGGNKKLRREVQTALGNREVVMADNVLPRLDTPNPLDVRDKIGQVFLDRIVAGKGLDRLSAALGVNPRPTPYSVLQLVTAMDGIMDDFILIDMGGATTDIYSSVKVEPPSAGRIYRGLPEPRIKRSVEGDMGMRVGAVNAAEAVGAGDDLVSFAKKVTADPSYLPSSPDSPQGQLDRSLAEAICQTAMVRHGGTMKRIFTAQGEAQLIEGKDLTQVKTIIGSGGFLSRMGALSLLPEMVSYNEVQSLLPAESRYLTDSEYIIPLVANWAMDFPVPAADFVVEHLKEIKKNEEQ